MFGISAFAQTPFASLAGNSYALSLTEDLQPADASTQLSTYNTTVTEDSQLTTLSSEGGFVL